VECKIIRHWWLFLDVFAAAHAALMWPVRNWSWKSVLHLSSQNRANYLKSQETLEFYCGGVLPDRVGYFAIFQTLFPGSLKRLWGGAFT
jgi:hypothetical protein